MKERDREYKTLNLIRNLYKVNNACLCVNEYYRLNDLLKFLVNYY
jgi:hypothetical protein